MRNSFKRLLGAALALLGTLGAMESASAQERIVFYAPVTVTTVSRKTQTVTTTTTRQIMTMNEDGSDVRQITFGTDNCYHPVWRPGRTHIAYFRKTDTGSDLYCMNADGSNAFVVATGTGGAGADWSPEGGKLCFPGRDALGQYGLIVVSVDPSAKGRNKVGTPTRIWNGSTYGPNWSRDGSKIAFSTYPTGGIPYITVLHLATGVANTLDMPHSLLPSWSKIDDRLAFVAPGSTPEFWQLWIMNHDFSGLTQVTEYPNSVLWPSWAADSSQIAFRIGTGQGDDAAIYKLTLATGELTLLHSLCDHPDFAP